jgi:hypothetical protein
MSPMPAVMSLAGASEPAHSTSVTAFGGVATGSGTNAAGGGGLRVSHRLSRDLSLGADGVGGATFANATGPAPLAPHVSRALYAGRAHLQYNPRGTEHLAFTLGLGGGGLTDGLGYLTADVGARVSGRFIRGLVEPFVGGVVALSGTVVLPQPTTTTSDTGELTFSSSTNPSHRQTLFAAVDAGLVLHAADRVDIAVDLLLVFGETFGVESRDVLAVPTVGARYRFGGADDAAAR